MSRLIRKRSDFDDILDGSYVLPAAVLTLSAVDVYDIKKAALIGEAWEYVQTLGWGLLGDDSELWQYLREALWELQLLPYWNQDIGDLSAVRRELLELVYEWGDA